LKKTIKPKNFLPTAYYEGGHKKLSEFIGKQLKYPEEALKHKIEGTVVLKYEIDYKGNVIRTKVISGIGHGCDEEAERLVLLLKFKVSKMHDLRFTINKSLNIHFKLPKPTIDTKLNYTVTFQPTKKQEAPVSYTYKVVLNK
jgi:TonB family protein